MIIGVLAKVVLGAQLPDNIHANHVCQMVTIRKYRHRLFRNRHDIHTAQTYTSHQS